MKRDGIAVTWPKKFNVEPELIDRLLSERNKVIDVELDEYERQNAS